MTKLTTDQLFQSCDPDSLDLDNVSDLNEISEIVGQDRALEAIHFGIGIRHAGFNLFALGSSESGRHSLTLELIQKQARAEATPQDWVYVNNFGEANKPYAISLPSGHAVQLREDMKQLVDELRSAVPAVFESDEYRARLQEIEDAFKERQSKSFEEIGKEAEGHNIALLRTPTGFVFAPTRNGEVIEPAEYEKLPEKERGQIEEVMAVLQEHLEGLLMQFPRWRKEMNEQVRQLNHNVVMSAVGQLISEMRKKYQDEKAIHDYLDAVQKDVIDNAAQFRSDEERIQSPGLLPGAELERNAAFLTRYSINVIVDNTDCEGAPVIYETNPSYVNLIGRVEHIAQMGALVTDFSLIKPGALHKANGGYLVLDARRILMQPYAWEGLKQALQSDEIRIESLGQALSLISTVSLEPETIPLSIKVVLIGDRILYYLLCNYDPDFQRLFKVPADFEDDMDRNEKNHREYAHVVTLLARREGLHPLDKQAIARVIEHSARMAGDAEKLSTQIGKIVNLLQEADYWATSAGSTVITQTEIQKSIDADVFRNRRIHERILQEIHRGTLLVSTTGDKVGQINGLTVMQLGDFAFGHPARISVQTHPGKGVVVDIEREVKLGGPIHSKGVMILAGFLSGRYAQKHPLALAASIVFEQSYGGVEGDSASSAELYALLSSIAEVPIRQSLAVTGSVNQNGEVQAIGGVNEKIEGFFEVCANRGLTGEQGVLIPESNVKHLMLREDVREAVDQGKFAIHAIRHIDEGLELLTGLQAGERDADGVFPEGSLNRLVEERLKAMYLIQRPREHDRDAS